MTRDATDSITAEDTEELVGCPYQQDAGTCYYCNHQGGTCDYDGYEDECPLLQEEMGG